MASGTDEQDPCRQPYHRRATQQTPVQQRCTTCHAIVLDSRGHQCPGYKALPEAISSAEPQSLHSAAMSEKAGHGGPRVQSYPSNATAPVLGSQVTDTNVNNFEERAPNFAAGSQCAPESRKQAANRLHMPTLVTNQQQHSGTVEALPTSDRSSGSQQPPVGSSGFLSGCSPSHNLPVHEVSPAAKVMASTNTATTASTSGMMPLTAPLSGMMSSVPGRVSPMTSAEPSSGSDMGMATPSQIPAVSRPYIPSPTRGSTDAGVVSVEETGSDGAGGGSGGVGGDGGVADVSVAGSGGVASASSSERSTAGGSGLPGCVGGGSSGGAVGGDGLPHAAFFSASFNALRYRCATCGRDFPRPYNLQRHALIHTDARPYECPVPSCKKRFRMNYRLLEHSRTHTGERPHPCPKCDESFINSTKLTEHFNRMHAESKPHPCPFCDKSFVRRDHLHRHCLAVHQQEVAMQ